MADNQAIATGGFAPISSNGCAAKSASAKAAVFDIGGVITRSPILAIGAYERDAGLPRGTLSRTFGTSLAFVDLECGRISRATFARLFESEVAAVLAAAALGDVNSGDAHTHGKDGTGTIAAGHRFNGQRLLDTIEWSASFVDPAMVGVVAALRSAGVPVAALTNNFGTAAEIQEAGGSRAVAGRSGASDGDGADDLIGAGLGTEDGFRRIKALFDAVVESRLVGVRKPDPRIYALAAESLGVAVDACVFLDDLGVNLKAAQRLGMATIKVGRRSKVAAISALQDMFPAVDLSRFVAMAEQEAEYEAKRTASLLRSRL